jgi:streptogramin lyase
MKRFILIFFLLITTSFQAQELNFENAQLRLPSTEVYQVFQDSKGFIWIVTDAGVCRYDGNTLKTFTVKDGICENVVLKIKEDSQKRVWFFTVSGYFFYYENGRFTNILANTQLKKTSITPNCDFSFGEKDTLFIYKLQRLFLKIPSQSNYKDIIEQPLKGQTVRYLIRNNIFPADPIMISNSNEGIRKDSSYSLYLFDTLLNISLKGISGYMQAGEVASAHLAANGMVYLPQRNKLVMVNTQRAISYYFFPDRIHKIYTDRDGDLWICTKGNGVYMFKNADMTRPPIHSLPSLSVSSVLVDKEGSVWVSTLEKGVFQCMNKHVRMIPENATDFRRVKTDLIISLASQKELTANSADSLTLKKLELPTLKNEKLTSLLKIKGTRYYGLKENLLSETNGTTREISYAPRNHTIPVNYLIELSNDTVLAVWSIEIAYLVHSKVVNHIRSSLFINFATLLPDKTLLVSSRSDQGLFEIKNNKFHPYLNTIKELKTRINWVTIDSSGNLWIATNEKGLYCYDSRKQLHVYNEKNGLISNKVNACAVASNGDVWCSTYSGLSKLTASMGLENIQIENFDKNHGLVDLEIDKIACFDNTIWCAGKTALFFFDPNKMRKNTFPPGIYIKSLNIKNKDQATGDSLFLNYDQNDFRIQYSNISYKKTNTPTFLYKLNGYDKNWNISNTGDIQYTNIGHGTYTLLVYGVNNDGVKSKTPQKITFIIKKPFWFTWWFIVLELAVVYIIIHILLVYWRKKIEKREQEKTAKETERTRMNQRIAEFQMTALRSQMNPHFIYNAIGSIQHYILKNEIDQSFNYLSKFSSLIRKVLNNSSSEFITLEDEITTLQLYIDLEQIRFKHPFKFSLHIDEELDMETDIPTMLIQPYIENSIWHGLMPKELEGKLELIFKKVDSTIHVTVRDNGVGRDHGDLTKKYHISKGMSLTAQRIQTLEKTSKKKYVTAVIDLKDEYGNPIGTEVNLIIPFDE